MKPVAPHAGDFAHSRSPGRSRQGGPAGMPMCALEPAERPGAAARLWGRRRAGQCRPPARPAGHRHAAHGGDQARIAGFSEVAFSRSGLPYKLKLGCLRKQGRGTASPGQAQRPLGQRATRSERPWGASVS
jgi:hypothetical protein